MSRHVTFMTIDDAEHYSPDERAAIIAAYPEHEREARARGIPVLGSGRIFPIAEELIACEPFRLPRYWPRIGALDFGWDHPSAAVELAWDTEADVVYVTKAARASQQTPAMQVLALKPWGEWLPWAWPRDGRRETLEGAGTALARQYAAHGLNMLAGHARFADGSVSVEAGLMDMLDRMQSGRFKVFSTLLSWFEEFRLYHRKDGLVVKLRDDLMAATRYRKLTLAYVSGAGTLPTTANGIWLMFGRAGDKGADGTGTGDFSGPASSVTDNIVTFAGVTGKAGKDSGIKASDLIAGPASAIADNIATFNGTTGKLAKDSGVKASDLIAGPASAVADNIATFNGTTGKSAKDSGVAVSSLAPKASPTFTGVPAAPTAAPGTNTTQLATTGFVKAAMDVVLGGVSASFDTLAELAAAITGLPFSKSYESAQQTYTLGGLLTLAHGLGVKPKLYAVFLQCTTADSGWAIGDEIPQFQSNGAGNKGIVIWADATNLNVRMGTTVVDYLNKGNGSGVTLTASSWKVVARAWA